MDILKSLADILLSSIPKTNTETIRIQTSNLIVNVQRFPANSSLESFSSHLGSIQFLRTEDLIGSPVTLKVTNFLHFLIFDTVLKRKYKWDKIQIFLLYKLFVGPERSILLRFRSTVIIA